ncbi:BTAD domain-containing putative transcriptional regulator [Amycolatopsis sp. NPDC059021]|uniref:BTAD domain-containing putative transcriptional regulator n=1 Tax=Amycolatopsis sp. NPDC059021 TaxID=3346704 RepID=UPI00366AB384
MPEEDDELRAVLLGPVSAHRADIELPLGPTRQRAVFAVLAERAGRPVPRAELVSAIWGAQPPASVNGNIHTYISGLRRALEPERGRWAAGELLTSTAAGYTLRIARENVDTARFERLLERARGETDARTTAGLLDDALALWRGEPLSGLPGPFAEQARARLAELRVTAHELRAAALLDCGAHGELTAGLLALVHEYPLRERLSELLMLALYRDGQHAKALEVFSDVRGRLREDLGVEPGPELRELQSRILAQDPGLDPHQNVAAPAHTPKHEPLLALPAQVARRRQSTEDTTFVGREEELALLRDLVDNVRDGRGGMAWVEGEFGIGKSELLVTALTDAPDRGCQLGWAIADELSGRIPLQVMLACLGIDKATGDPAQSALALGLFDPQNTGEDRDPALATVGRLLSLIDELCARGPLVLVVDDMQWADEASVLLWHRLTAATRQLPLLLVTAARPVPRTPQLVRLRQAIGSRGGAIIDLAPLTDEQTLELEKHLLGAEPGPELQDLVERTTGNPLYITELTGTLIRERALRTTSGVTDLADSSTYAAPRSLIDTIRRNLDVLSAETHEALRWAALLGTEFTVTDIAAVAGKRPSELVMAFEESVAANVIVDADTHLAFRHPLLRQAFYDGIPAGARAALHRQAAEALAGVGSPVTRVAEQVVATPVPDLWVLQWLVDNGTAVANRAPLLAAELLARGLEACPLRDARREVLAAALVKVLFRLERQPEEEARAALAIATDPYRAAEMRQLLAAMRYRRGDAEAAVRTVEKAVDDPAVPEIWRQRHRHLLANFRRGGLDDLDAAEESAHQALAAADGDAYLTAHALQTLWLTSSVRRHHETALAHIDNALDVAGRGGDLAELELDLLDNRLFTLQNLDRLTEADDTLRTARRIAISNAFGNELQVPAAVHDYWTGRWNEALVELDTVAEDGPAITFLGLREPPAAALLLHGVAAYIAARRGDRAQAAAHLEAVEEYAPATSSERESIDFLLVAHSLTLEQRGRPEEALEVLEPLLTPEFSPMMLRHQWLPMIVRLALDIGATDRAHDAMRICAEEAAKERPAARAAAAARWCRGLIDQDPAPVLAAADHYRRVGRVVELGMALEDASALLAKRGETEAAQAAFAESAALYADLSASWDLERATNRLAAFGIRRDVTVPRPRSRHGWESLSPVERKIARLVAAGHSNPAIAEHLDLPRRTVQAHVARLLGKLGTTSRDRVAAEIGALNGIGGSTRPALSR